MKETAVHVTTLEQWKSVLDVWFEQGYGWTFTNDKYNTFLFDKGARFLFLDDYVTYSNNNYHNKPYIEYSEFMAQQKEDNKMATYYVTKEKLDLIKRVKGFKFPLYKLLNDDEYYSLSRGLDENKEKALLRYLGGDETIEFKVKELLYRLWRIDDVGDKAYMQFTLLGNPDWTGDKNEAFTAPLEEIKKHKTVSWDIEEVN